MKINKQPNKTLAPLSADLLHLKTQLLEASVDAIPALIHTFNEWKYPRGDFFQWIPVLNKFDELLDKACRDHGLYDGVQTRPFAESTCRLICAILWFTRMLMENCINRNLYNSFAQLRALLYTCHLDVLEDTLYIVLRISQRMTMHHQRSSRSTLTQFKKVALVLGESWDHGSVRFKLTDVAGPAETVGANPAALHFAFYQTNPDTANAGHVVVTLAPTECQGQPAVALFQALVQRHAVPTDQHLRLFHRILVAQHFHDPPTRHRLLTCRLIAMALQVMILNEHELNRGLFLYQSDIGQNLTDLLHQHQSISHPVQTAAMYLLEALIRQRSLIQEVLTALNVSASHGVLMNMLRQLFPEEPAASEPDALPQTYTDALCSLLSAIATNPNGSQLLISAGVVSAFVGFLTNRQLTRKRALAKATRLLDNLIYSYTSAFTSFCSANGVSALVERIGHEVQDILQLRDQPTATSEGMMEVEGMPMQPGAAFEQVPLPTATMLKDLLRFLQHMMNSAETADRLRNLVETPLPKTMLHIVRYPELFGSSIYVYTLNIMASFIHNEPTSLAILQELHLPQTFLKALKRGILQSSDVFTSLPNAMGAVCLNQAGLDYFIEQNPLIEYFAAFTSMDHVRSLQETDIPAVAGAGVDELIRHHPPLKPLVVKCLHTVLDTLREYGRVGSPPNLATPEKIQLRTSDDSVTAEDKDRTPDEMVLSQMIEALCRFLEGFFQNPQHRSDVARDLGVGFLLEVLQFPALPFDFLNSRGWGSLVGLFKTIIDVSYAETSSRPRNQLRMNGLDGVGSEPAAQATNTRDGESDTNDNALSRSAPTDQALPTASEAPPAPGPEPPSTAPSSSVPATTMQTTEEPAATTDPVRLLIDAIQQTLQGSSILSHYQPLADTAAGSTVRWARGDTPDTNPRFRELVTLAGLVALFAELYVPFNHHGPSYTTITSWLMSSAYNGLLVRLGELYQFAVWEGIHLQSLSLPATPAEPCEPSYVLANARYLEALLAKVRASVAHMAANMSTYVVSRRPLTSEPRQEALATAQQLADVFINHVTWLGLESSQTRSAFVWHYYLAVLGHLAVVFVDGSSSLHLQLPVWVPFIKRGGLDALLSLLDVAWQQASPATRTKQRAAESARAPSGTLSNQKDLAPLLTTMDCDQLIDQVLEALFSLLQFFVNHKLIHESPHVSHLTTKDKAPSDPDYFQVNAFVVQVRAQIMPKLLACWQSPELTKFSYHVVQTLCECLVPILKREGEKKPAVEPGITLANPLAPLLPQLTTGLPVSADALRSLEDMGFPRSRAEYALRRNFNNVVQAANYLASLSEYEPASQATSAPPPPPPSDARPETPSPAAAEPSHDPRAAPGDTLASVMDVENAETNPAPAGSANDADLTPTMPNKLAEYRLAFGETGLGRLVELLLSYPEAIFQFKAIAAQLCAHDHATVVPRLMEWITSAGEAALCSCNAVSSPAANMSESGTVMSANHRYALALRLLALLLNDTKVQHKVYTSSLSLVETLLRQVGQVATRPDELATEADTPLDTDALQLFTTSNPRAHYVGNAQCPKLPSWLSSALVVLETYLRLTDEPKAATPPENQTTLIQPAALRIEDTPSAAIAPSSSDPSNASPSVPQALSLNAKLALVPSILRLLSTEVNSTTGQVYALLSLLVQLTRTAECAREFARLDGVPLLLTPLKDGRVLFRMQRDFVLLVLRHVLEQPTVLQAMMSRRIKQWLGAPRTRLLEVNTLVRHNASLALRAPDCFLRAVAATCHLPNYDPNARSHPVASKPESSDETFVEHLKTDDLADLKNVVEPVVRYLMHAVLSLREPQQALEAQVDQSPADAPHSPPPALATALDSSAATEDSTAKSATAGDPATQKFKHPLSQAKTQLFHLISYRCFLLTALTELLSAFPGLQVMLLDDFKPCAHPSPATPLPKGTVRGIPHPRPSPTRSKFLHHLLWDLLSPSSQYFRGHHHLSVSFQQYLCVDGLLSSVCLESRHGGQSTPNAVTDDLTLSMQPVTNAIRTFVLDGIATLIPETMHGQGAVHARYSRIWALATLCDRLLVTRALKKSAGRDSTSNSNRELAVDMLDHDFVGLLTGVVAELDLNHPHCNTMLTSVLRPLELLTELSSKRSKQTSQSANGTAPPTDATADAALLPERQQDGATGMHREDPPVSGESPASSEQRALADTSQVRSMSPSALSQDEEEGERSADDLVDEDIPDLYRTSALGMIDGAAAMTEEDGLDEEGYEEDGYDEGEFTDDYDATGSDFSDSELDDNMEIVLSRTYEDDETDEADGHDGSGTEGHGTDGEHGSTRLGHDHDMAFSDDYTDDDHEDDGSSDGATPELMWQMDDVPFDNADLLDDGGESAADTTGQGSLAGRRTSRQDGGLFPELARRRSRHTGPGPSGGVGQLDPLATSSLFDPAFLDELGADDSSSMGDDMEMEVMDDDEDDVVEEDDLAEEYHTIMHEFSAMPFPPPIRSEGLLPLGLEAGPLGQPRRLANDEEVTISRSRQREMTMEFPDEAPGFSSRSLFLPPGGEMHLYPSARELSGTASLGAEMGGDNVHPLLVNEHVPGPTAQEMAMILNRSEGAETHQIPQLAGMMVGPDGARALSQALTRQGAYGLPARLSGHTMEGFGLSDLSSMRHRRMQVTGSSETRRLLPPWNASGQLPNAQGSSDDTSTESPADIAWNELRFAEYIRYFSPKTTQERWVQENNLLYRSHSFTYAQRLIQDTLAVLIPPPTSAPASPGPAAETAPSPSPGNRDTAPSAQLPAPVPEDTTPEIDIEGHSSPELASPPQSAAASPPPSADAEMAPASQTDSPAPSPSPAPSRSPSPPASETQHEATGGDQSNAVTITDDQVMVGGRVIDISNTGIDPTFLAALPEELRLEVLREHVPSAAAQPAPPAHDMALDTSDEISAEFLDALPPDIRQEVLEQQALDRRRRQLLQRSWPVQPSGTTEASDATGSAPPTSTAPPAATDLSGFGTASTRSPWPSLLDGFDLGNADPFPRWTMPPAQFLSSGRGAPGNQPTARATILPPTHVATLTVGPAGANRASAFARALALAPGPSSANGAMLHPPPRPPATRTTGLTSDAAQLLSRQELAALARLLFVPTQMVNDQLLPSVLLNLCDNSKTRSDLIAFLLSVLQEGAQDFTDVDRCLSHLSQRSSKALATPSKTPIKGRSAPLTPARPLPFAHSAQDSEVASTSFPAFIFPLAGLALDSIPNLPAQCSLNALISFVEYNHAATQFFLTENDHLCLRKPHRKGKQRDKQAVISKYPVVVLLGLLDRPTIMDNSLLVENLMYLLATVCRVLPALVRKHQRHAPSTPTAVAADPAPSSATSGPATTPGRPAPIKPSPPLPVIPAHYAQAVVNALTHGECSSRTFQYTLTLIQHLLVLPEAGQAIVDELVQSAQRLANQVLANLAELIPRLQGQLAEDELANDDLTPFTPASSNQAKMLRVLKTLDYVYHKQQTQASNDAITAPTNEDTTTAMDVDAPGATASGPVATTRDSISAALVNGFAKFRTLWIRLGEALRMILDKPALSHVATVLLPLIESFMVVSHHVVSQTGGPAEVKSQDASPIERDLHSSSPEEFFLMFTEHHRKVLNTLVRNNPSLMSGSFALLVHNPKVLEFDNKRNYFTQQLHKRASGREVHSSLRLNVRRQYVFEDSFHQLQGHNGREIKYGKLNVKFYHEEGIDMGGVTREWFQVLSRQMFNPDYALFKTSAVDKVTYQPNPASWVNPDHLMYFKFVGRIIGKAIFDGRLLDCYFTRSFYKHMLGRSVDYRDMEAIDPEYYKSLVWMLEHDITDVFDLTFSLEVEEFGKESTVELKPNGSEIPVTEENKHEYVRLVCEQRLTRSIQDQIDHFLTGFHDVIPRDLVQIFNEQELELLISGLPDIDIDDWKNNTEYRGYSVSSLQIRWFWRGVRSFDQEERAKLLQFVTGTSKVPLQGFSALQGSTGIQKFQVHKDFSATSRLPSAHTCFNQLDLPEYETYEQLRSQLLLAINECSTGFSLA
ncbi:E3 ubiquitin-protein ligase tom1 [Dimargaris verticillata]|uniref:HECT-type E3 ubiquitin transferase n=1 Tax=Dimargaris verticillata TaxID=2761393 RepID=A0A9W8BAQ7_9FUNG|nr:E3 ubiquitin-protein ligase tom1 [Dimargaris verticillata]